MTTDHASPPLLPHAALVQRAAGAPDRLPPQLRLLWLSRRPPDWRALALRLDAAGCTDPRIQWALDGRTALVQLRRETFDGVIVLHDATETEPPQDLAALLAAIRAGGHDGPLLLIAPRLEDRAWLPVLEFEAEVFVTPLGADSPAVIGMLQRAIAQAARRAEHRRLAESLEQRLIREHDEAERLLTQQQELLEKLQQLTTGSALPAATHARPPEPPDATADGPPAGTLAERFGEAADVPEEIGRLYEELLRTHVMMGTGGLQREVAQLAQALAELRISPRQAVTLHLRQVECLVAALGGRSRRHVLDRADLLILELMTCLGTQYYQQSGGSRAVPLAAQRSAATRPEPTL